MGEAADRVRLDIERTRADMTGTIDAIEDRVSPRRIVERRTDKIRSGMRSAREAVMGTADDTTTAVGARMNEVGDGVSSAMSAAADTVQSAPEAARRTTRGNPLAAGVIAFGGGLLLATLLPTTDVETEAAGSLAPHLEPIKEQAIEVGRQVKDELSATAADGTQQVKDQATEATHQVAETASAATQDVTDAASAGAHRVADQASPPSA